MIYFIMLYDTVGIWTLARNITKRFLCFRVSRNTFSVKRLFEQVYWY